MSLLDLEYSFQDEKDYVLTARADLRSSPDFNDLAALRQKGVIENLLGSFSEVFFGKPKVVELDKTVLGKFINLKTYNITSRLFLVYLTCTFRPAPDTDFIRGSLKLRICYAENQRGCLVLDLFPREVYMTVNYKKSVKLSPSLKLSFDKISSAEIAVGEVSASEEYMRYEPEITAFGTGETTFGWDFNRSKSRPIRGIKDLYSMIEAPREPKSMRYAIDADIQTRLGVLRLPAFLDASDGSPIISKEISLELSR
jgi:hypothetical protein